MGVVCEQLATSPNTSVDQADVIVHDQVFEPLYRRLSSRTAFTGVVAADPPVPVSGTLWTYRVPIRRGLRFSDGSRVTATDVAASLRRAHACPDGWQLSVEGEHLLVTLDREAPDLGARLSNPWLAITKADPSGGPSLGTGPYRVLPESTPQRMQLGPNPHFVGERPRIERVEVVAFPPTARGVASLIEAVERGVVHFTNHLTRDALDRLRKVRKAFQPGNSTCMLWLNARHLPAVRQRQALLLALDRYTLAGLDCANPAGFVARGVLPPRFSDYRDGNRFDPELARRLLTAEPIDRELQLLRIWGPRPYLADPERLSAAIVGALEAIGLRIRVRAATDPRDYQARLRAGEYDMVLGGWNGDLDDPSAFLDALFSSDAMPAPGRGASTGCNWSRWNNPELQALLDGYRHKPSEPRQRRVLDCVDAAHLVLPIHHGAVTAASSWDLAPFELDFRGIPRIASWTFRR